MQKNNALVSVVAAIIFREDQVLIVRRGLDMSGAGNWEFPGGKIEPGETEIEALKREIKEELKLTIEVLELIGENTHQYPSKKIHLRFYWVPMPNENFILTEHDAHQWVRPSAIDITTLSEADRPIVDALKDHPRMRRN